MDKREIKQYWLCNACNEVYETVNNNGFEYEIEDIEVECPHCHDYMDIYEIDKEYYDKIQEMSKKINDLKKRDKRHQRETQRETQNKQSKEFKLFDKQSKEYSYSLIFTNDLKEIFDSKSDCKALFEKDQDNDYFYVFDKNGKYIKCISQENNFNGTWNEFKSYSMIQWSNSECTIIYLKDYSETTIESILEAYLIDFGDYCLENDLMEDNMENNNTVLEGLVEGTADYALAEIKNGVTTVFLDSEEELADLQMYFGEDLSDVEYCGGSGTYPSNKWYYATYYPNNEEVNIYI